MRKVRTRLTEHRSNIRCKRATTKMSTHYIETGHKPNDFHWVVLEQIPDTPTSKKVLFEKEQR